MAHESDAQERRRRDRTDDRAAGDVVAYEDENGVPLAWTGNEDAPYVGVIPVDGAPLEFSGDVAAGAVDSGNPIKIGGIAKTSETLPAAVDVGDRVDARFDVYGNFGVVPWATETTEVELRDDAILTSAFVSTSIVDVRGWRRLNLTIRYQPGAVGGYPQILPFIAKTAAAPPLNSDDWSDMTVNDGTFTAAVLTPAMPAGTIITTSPAWGPIINYQLVLQTTPALILGERIRQDVPLVIDGVKWMRFLCAERGVAGTPGTLGLRYNFSSG